MNALNYLRPKDRTEARLLVTVLLTALFMAVVLMVVRRTAAFSENLELPLYDQVTELTWPWEVGHEDIVLVTQHDNQAFKWPLPDAILASVLERIGEGHPAVIAIDLAKEDKVDADPAELQQLAEIVRRHNIVWAYRMAEGGNPRRTLPSYMLSQPAGDLDFLSGFADFPKDHGSNPKIRRAFFARAQGDYFSLAAATAVNYALTHDQRDWAGDLRPWCEKHFRLAPDAGGYALAGEERDEFLIKYGPGLDRHFDGRHHSLRELLDMNARQLRDTFEGKIVFLGTGPGTGTQDEKPVIGNDGELRGVKLQALATAQILREMTGKEPGIRTLPDAAEDMLIVLLGLLTLGIFLRWPVLGSWKSVAVVLLLLAVNLGLAVLFLKAGYWVPMAGPMIITAGAGFSTVAMLFAHMRSEASKAYLLLVRNAGPALARVIWINRTRILGNKKVSTAPFTGTIFFSDLAGYTPALKEIEERFGAPAAAKWIGDYMETMIALVTEHHGFVKDFEGDAIMAIFGFPADGSDVHAARAVRCARAMDQQFHTLNAALPPDYPRYRTRIGIYTGEIKPEHLSTELMFEFSFTGFAVNKAKRLETFEKGAVDWADRQSRILIGARTHELMDPATKAVQVPGPSQIDPNIPPEYIWELTNAS